MKEKEQIKSVYMVNWDDELIWAKPGEWEMCAVITDDMPVYNIGNEDFLIADEPLIVESK